MTNARISSAKASEIKQDLNLQPIDYERIEILLIQIIKGDFQGTVPHNVPQKMITGEGV